MFFEKDGVYTFEPTKIKDAHLWCQKMVESDMYNNTNRIIVSNTFTTEWEMKPYFDMAKKYGYMVFTLIVENRHNGKNVHNVPEDKVQQMKERFNISL